MPYRHVWTSEHGLTAPLPHKNIVLTTAIVKPWRQVNIFPLPRIQVHFLRRPVRSHFYTLILTLHVHFVFLCSLKLQDFMLLFCIYCLKGKRNVTWITFPTHLTYYKFWYTIWRCHTSIQSYLHNVVWFTACFMTRRCENFVGGVKLLFRGWW